MPRDYYKEARDLGKTLKLEGCNDMEDRINFAIASGFSSTEILMKLRWELQNIDKSKFSISAETQAKLDEILFSLDKVLS